MAEWPCCHDPLRFSPMSLRFVPPTPFQVPPTPFQVPARGLGPEVLLYTPEPPDESDQVFETYARVSTRWRLWFLEISPETVKKIPCTKTNKSRPVKREFLLGRFFRTCEFRREPIRPSKGLIAPQLISNVRRVVTSGWKKHLDRSGKVVRGTKPIPPSPCQRTCRKR